MTGGQWPDVEIGNSYRVNKSASGNSAAREDQVGTCVEKRESSFGHRWAVLDFPDGSREAVRTVLLVQVEPEAQAVGLPGDRAEGVADGGGAGGDAGPELPAGA